MTRVPSHYLAGWQALTDLAATLTADADTCHDVGPAFTCSESDAIRHALAVVDPDAADRWHTGHLSTGTHDDEHEHTNPAHQADHNARCDCDTPADFTPEDVTP